MTTQPTYTAASTEDVVELAIKDSDELISPPSNLPLKTPKSHRLRSIDTFNTAAQLPRQMSNVKSENYGSMCGIFWQLCGLLTSTFCVVLIDIIGLAWCIPLLNTICDTNQAPGINLSIIQIVVYGSSIQIMVAFIVFIIGAFAWCIDNAKEDGCDEEILNRLWIAALIFIIFSTLILGTLAIIGLIIRFNPEYSLNLCKPHINTFSAIWCIFKIVFPLCFCWTCFV